MADWWCQMVASFRAHNSYYEKEADLFRERFLSVTPMGEFLCMDASEFSGQRIFVFHLFHAVMLLADWQ